MMIINDKTIVASLTVGDLKNLLASFKLGEAQEQPKHEVTYVYGLRGIQHLLGCSHTQAQRYKDGILRPAVMQNGRKIMVDSEMALKLFAEHGNS